MSEDHYKVMEARCPECGSPDVDLSFSLKPIQDGVKCYDCGCVYELNENTGVEIGREGFDERMSKSGWFSWTESLRDFLKERIGG